MAKSADDTAPTAREQGAASQPIILFLGQLHSLGYLSMIHGYLLLTESFDVSVFLGADAYYGYCLTKWPYSAVWV